jgi:hypothetical protein
MDRGVTAVGGEVPGVRSPSGGCRRPGWRSRSAKFFFQDMRANGQLIAVPDLITESGAERTPPGTLVRASAHIR